MRMLTYVKSPRQWGEVSIYLRVICRCVDDIVLLFQRIAWSQRIFSDYVIAKFESNRRTHVS